MKPSTPNPSQATPPTPSPASLPASLALSESYRRHRRQTFWQIWFPLGLFVLLILAAAVGVVLTGVWGDANQALAGWSNVSQIWLVIPVILSAVLILVIAAGSVFFDGKTIENPAPIYAVGAGLCSPAFGDGKGLGGSHRQSGYQGSGRLGWLGNPPPAIIRLKGIIL